MLRPGLASGRSRLSLGWLVFVPFFAYTIAFLFLPAANVVVGAFQGTDGGYTLDNVREIFRSPHDTAFMTSIRVSIVTAVLGGMLGLLIAYAAIREGTPRWIRTGIATFSGVAANFAGIPLAFAFIATLGVIGIVTTFLRDLGIDIYSPDFGVTILGRQFPDGGFQLFTETGVVLTYLYFQIPLMILVIAPAIDGLRREWREAASNLGASNWQFWRLIGFPILLPSLLGAVILLFGNAFSAYATAYGLTAGAVNLVPIVIGYYYSGDVLSNPHVAEALALGMFAVLALMMIVYVPLMRRAQRWAR